MEGALKILKKWLCNFLNKSSTKITLVVHAKLYPPLQTLISNALCWSHRIWSWSSIFKFNQKLEGGAFFDRKPNLKINFLLIFMAESVENLKNIDFIQCQKSTRCKNLITSCALCNIRIFSHSRGVSNLMSYLHQHLSLESYACPLSRHLRCFM